MKPKKQTIVLGEYVFTKTVTGNRVEWSRNRLPSETYSVAKEFALGDSEVALAEEVLRFRNELEEQIAISGRPA